MRRRADILIPNVERRVPGPIVVMQKTNLFYYFDNCADTGAEKNSWLIAEVLFGTKICLLTRYLDLESQSGQLSHEY